MRIIFPLIVFFSFLLSSSLASLAVAEAPHELKPYVGSKALERIKKLEGDWHGKMVHKPAVPEQTPADDSVAVNYRVTSNGSAVVETIFKGTPMEMTSVYFDRDGKLNMTHYCSVANRPELALVKESGERLTLSYSGGEELNPKEDMHIHGLELEFVADGKLVQHWQGFEKGKQTHNTVLSLSRLKR